MGLALRQDLAGEHAGIEDRLRGAVGADRIHRMRGVAHQRDAAERPLRERIAVDQRIFVGVRAVADQAGHVEPVELPVLEPRQEFLELRGAVVVLAPPLVGRRHVPLGDPVDPELARRVRLLRNRIADEFQDLVAGHDHGAAGEERIRRGDAAPQDAAVPDRRALLRIELVADRGMDAVGGDQQRAVMAGPRPAGRLVDEIGADAADGLASSPLR